jgi:hypothetical protein
VDFSAMDSSYILEIRLRGSILRESLAPPGLLQAFVAGLGLFRNGQVDALTEPIPEDTS